MLTKMFAAMLVAFLWTLDPHFSKSLADSKVLNPSPVLQFHPAPSEADVGNSLISYSATGGGNWRNLTNQLDEFLGAYRYPGLMPGRGQNVALCDYGHPPKNEEVCDEDVKNWNPCTSENHYGYDKSTPCIFLRFNTIDRWEPDYYNKTDSLPEEMPEDLKEYIRQKKMEDRRKLNTVWVSCEGESPADVESAGNIQYLPSNRRGFPGYFYPFTNQEGYLAPIVAIHFERPKTGVMFNVGCKFWAEDLIVNRSARIGSVTFQLLID